MIEIVVVSKGFTQQRQYVQNYGIGIRPRGLVHLGKCDLKSNATLNQSSRKISLENQIVCQILKRPLETWRYA